MFDQLIESPQLTVDHLSMIREINEHGLEGRRLQYHTGWTPCNTRVIPWYDGLPDERFMRHWIEGINYV